MKRPVLHFHLWALLLVLTAGTSLQSFPASHCPGNIASVTPRFTQSASIVVPVTINQTGPFDFILDTGAQITIIDPALASELGLKPEGTVGLVSLADRAHASIAHLDRLETGSHIVERPYVAIQEIRQIQAVDPRIRGILGENFLAHFDLLIDYPHTLICLDDTGTMQENIRGEQIPLVTLTSPKDELPFTKQLILSVHLSGTGTRQTLLKLDSGSSGPVLFTFYGKPSLPVVSQWAPRGATVGRAQVLFTFLPPQEMKIGTRTFGPITFVTPVSFKRDAPKRDEDGLLPTVLFKRVYIDFSDSYVILEPR